MRVRSILIAAFGTLSLAGSANALTLDLTYSGAGDDVSAVLTVVPQMGGAPVTGISGTVGGDTITGLNTAFGPPDNTIYSSEPYLDGQGLAFNTASDRFVLYYSGEYTLFDGGADDSFSGGTVTLTAGSGAPEPAAWSLLVAGVGLAGYAVRRRRSVAAA